MEQGLKLVNYKSMYYKVSNTLKYSHKKHPTNLLYQETSKSKEFQSLLCFLVTILLLM